MPNPEIIKKLAYIRSVIKEVRIAKGYSQVYMGEQLGMSQNVYSKLEIGKTQLSAHRFLQIAEVLEIDIEILLK